MRLAEGEIGACIRAREPLEKAGACGIRGIAAQFVGASMATTSSDCRSHACATCCDGCGQGLAPFGHQPPRVPYCMADECSLFFTHVDGVNGVLFVRTRGPQESRRVSARDSEE